jgi:hypothetical protein
MEAILKKSGVLVLTVDANRRYRVYRQGDSLSADREINFTLGRSMTGFDTYKEAQIYFTAHKKNPIDS